MKRILVLLMLVQLPLRMLAGDEDGIVGKWSDHQGEAKVMIYKKGEKFFGKLYWLKDPLDEKGNVRKDKKNPAPEKRERALEGLEILQGFHYQNGIWTGGKIYDPRTGKSYDCKLSLSADGKLSIRGYLGFSFIGKTETMLRI